MFRSRSLRHSMVLLAPLAMAPSLLPAQETTARSWCHSDLQAPVVYFTQVFDARVPYRPDWDARPIASDFLEYLKGRYDFKTSANYPTGCGGSGSTGQAELQRAEFKSKAATAGNKVVELDWAYQPDSAAATATSGPNATSPTQADHGWCFSPGATGTVYAAGPFQLKGRMATTEWIGAFSKFLADKYGFRGGGTCAIGATLARAQRRMEVHIQGARAGSRKVVETGWEWATTTVDTEAAKPAPPSVRVHEVATNEVPQAMAYCQKDVLLSGAIDCSKVARAVYTYRMAHPDGTPEPLATLFSGDKLDCTGCLNQARMTRWAEGHAKAQGLTPEVGACVGPRFFAGFQAKPYPHRIKEAYDAAVAACKR